VIAAVNRPGNKQVLPWHVYRLPISQSDQGRFHDPEAFVEAKEGLYILVRENEWHSVKA
jgi:hypothetical protein